MGCQIICTGRGGEGQDRRSAQQLCTQATWHNSGAPRSGTRGLAGAAPTGSRQRQGSAATWSHQLHGRRAVPGLCKGSVFKRRCFQTGRAGRWDRAVQHRAGGGSGATEPKPKASAPLSAPLLGVHEWGSTLQLLKTPCSSGDRRQNRPECTARRVGAPHPCAAPLPLGATPFSLGATQERGTAPPAPPGALEAAHAAVAAILASARCSIDRGPGRQPRRPIAGGAAVGVQGVRVPQSGQNCGRRVLLARWA